MLSCCEAATRKDNQRTMLQFSRHQSLPPPAIYCEINSQAHQYRTQGTRIQHLDRHRDIEKMQGSTVRLIWRRLRTAAVIQGVNELPWRLEAQYAYQRQVEMVPLMVEEAYSAKDWLGMLGVRLWCGSSFRYWRARVRLRRRQRNCVVSSECSKCKYLVLYSPNMNVKT